MNRSRNQLATALYKAWRAAGLPPGPAREIGRAGLRLAADPSQLEAAVPPDGFDPAWFSPPTRTEEGWSIGPTCAALHGPSVAELLVAHPERAVVAADPDEPRLLIAVLESIGEANGVAFSVAAADAGIVTVRVAGSRPTPASASDGMSVSASAPASASASAPASASTSVSTAPPSAGSATAPGPVDVPDDVWDRLGRWSERLLVPASDASRAGAGAGAIDND